MGSNPTLSAIPAPLKLHILWRPDAAWQAVRAAEPGWRRSLFGHVAPLALLPAISWPVGHALDPIGPQALEVAALAVSFAVTFLLCVATVVLAAAAIHLLAPVFGVARRWDAAMAVAAYASTPVLVAAPLLFSAVLTIIVVVAFFHACVLCSQGVRHVLGCRGEDASLYVAAVGFVSGIAGLILGGLSGAAGIL